MEDIYENVERSKPFDPKRSTNQTGPRSSERRFHGSVVLILGLLCVSLLVGLIGLGVAYLFIRTNLTKRLQASHDNLSSVSGELNSLQKKACPLGWMMFRSTGSCYYFSTESGSWYKGRDDCIKRHAQLTIIDSQEEQVAVSKLMKITSWIGLTETDVEGSWKWIDGTPLTLKFWQEPQPDDYKGGEDCVEIRAVPRAEANWNDNACNASLPWICEKKV